MTGPAPVEVLAEVVRRDGEIVGKPVLAERDALTGGRPLAYPAEGPITAAGERTCGNERATNMTAAEMVRDERGVRDPQYWCLPPFRGDPARQAPPSKGGYRYHLVWQGYTGVEEIGVDICVLQGGGQNEFEWVPGQCEQGIPHHRGMYRGVADDVPTGSASPPSRPHPVDPAHARPGTQPPQPPQPPPQPPQSAHRDNVAVCPPRPPKREAKEEGCRPPPCVNARTSATPNGGFVNFAIRGAGIVSSSPLRTQDRYEELQRRGEEPDVILTRSFARASLFALDDEGETREEGNMD
ncbi:hypothetical protein K438DRAFT_1751379 [Mycena galopus ATCC 62051]|nr:hypothetical protein K438DRAFT_1751379 [Mycena galopus ATCC 62051]